METPDYLNFSRIEGKEAQLRRLEKAQAALEEILDASCAARVNLMKTTFPAANALVGSIKSLIQAETASTMTMAVLAQRMGAKGGADFIEANVPGLKEPKQLKK